MQTARTFLIFSRPTIPRTGFFFIGTLMPQKHIALVIGLCLVLWGCDLNQGPLSDATGTFERAVNLFEEKSYQQAESLFVQSLSVFEQHGEIYNLVQANRYLGQIYLVKGRPFSALKRFQLGLRKTKEAKDFRAEMYLHSFVGDAFNALGRYGDANRSYHSSRQLSSAFNDLAFKADLERKMGTASLLGGRFEEALRELQSALAHHQSSNENVTAASILGTIGEVYGRQGRYDEALNSLMQARTLLEKLDQPVLDARLRMEIGLVFKAKRNLNDALQQLRDAANALRSKRVARENEILFLFHIGNIYFESGRYADAKKYYADAQGLARAVGNVLAELYQQILVLRCDERLVPAAQRMQAIDGIIADYVETSGRFQRVWHRTGEAFCFAEAGRLSELTGDVSKAREMYRKAVGIDEEIAGESIQPEYHRPYQEYLKIDGERTQWYTQLASLEMQANKPEEALALVERSSSKMLFTLFRDMDVVARHPELKDEVRLARAKLDELRMLQAEITSLLSLRVQGQDERVLADLRDQLRQLTIETKETSRRIVGAYANYEPLLRPDTFRLQEVQSGIPRGTILVRYLPANDQLYIFTISRSRFEVKNVIVTSEKLFSLMAEYQRLLHDPSVYTGTAGEGSVPSMTRFATLSTQLYDYLIRPVDPLLEQNLVIIMSPEFENFPFHTIERQDRKGSVKYLIEVTSVDYLPSLASYRFRVSNAARVRKVTALGNPTGKNWSIDYELRDIRSFYKDARILIAREASWENLAASKSDAVHLSTDFVMGEGSSRLGVIAVSNTRTLEEAAKIPFDRLSELGGFSVVVLVNQYGQGFGLSPAHAMLLRVNGTSDVFLNTWYADRKAAKFFSEFFYTHLSNGLAPGDAYRQALLNLIQTKDVNHPHSWGQFFHFGVG
ncbi:MAG TPA: hypothetical protein DCP63_06145 [Bacteroidetes bacterium]|nr:hypothetical protein [Bacteroidota bacterium]